MKNKFKQLGKYRIDITWNESQLGLTIESGKGHDYRSFWAMVSKHKQRLLIERFNNRFFHAQGLYFSISFDY